MKFKVIAQDFKVTKGIEAYLEDKLNKIEKFGVDTISVRLLNEGKDKKVSLSTIVNKKIVEVKEVHNDLYPAIDSAVNALEKVIVKQKGKTLSKRRSTKKTTNEVKLKEPTNNIKRQTLETKPMSEDEAILQVETFNYKSLLFHNTDTKTPCMIYKDYNGELLLVDTEAEFLVGFNQNVG